MVDGSFYELGVLFGGPCMKGPILLGPYAVPLVFGNLHMGPHYGPLLFGNSHLRILQSICFLESGILTRMKDPCVYMVFGSPQMCKSYVLSVSAFLGSAFFHSQPWYSMIMKWIVLVVR